jgi:hypothetical protein
MEAAESREQRCSTNNLNNVIHANYNFTYIKNWLYYHNVHGKRPQNTCSLAFLRSPHPSSLLAVAATGTLSCADRAPSEPYRRMERWLLPLSDVKSKYWRLQIRIRKRPHLLLRTMGNFKSGHGEKHKEGDGVGSGKKDAHGVEKDWGKVTVNNAEPWRPSSKRHRGERWKWAHKC